MLDFSLDLEEQQTTTMHEASKLVLRVRKAGKSSNLGLENPNSSSGGGGGAKAFSPESKDLALAATETSVLLAHGVNEGLQETDLLVSERMLTKSKLIVAGWAEPASTSALSKRQAREREGEASEVRPQRSASANAHLEDSSQSAKGTERYTPIKGAFATLDKAPHSQVLPLTPDPPSCIPEFLSSATGKDLSSEARAAAVGKRPARGEPRARGQGANVTPLPERSPASSKGNPSNQAPSMHPSNGPRPTAPTRDDLQGPSPVVQSLVLEADLPEEMVLEL
jgi:hypothetical protein